MICIYDTYADHINVQDLYMYSYIHDREQPLANLFMRYRGGLLQELC